METSFNDRVYKIARSIPKGYVMSYGQIAALAGNARASRAVGYAMFRCTRRDVPAHRVVYKDGSLADERFFAVGPSQKARLEAEGVAFTDDGRVNMNKHRHRPVLTRTSRTKKSN